MTLLIDELYPGVVFEQNFRIKRSIQVAYFRPWLIKWVTPSDGELVCQILKDDELLKEVRLTSTEINYQIVGTYAHGQIRFDTSPLQLNHDSLQEWTEYTVKIFVENYTKDINNFYGTIRKYELKFYDTYGDNVLNNEAPNDMVEPLGFEIYEWRY